ncbi:MAG: acyl-CoA dehydrogenase family protein [Gemmataceae bacterium]
MAELPMDLLRDLSASAESADRSPDWPASWTALRAAGVLAWSIPSAYGGAELEPVELLRRSEVIAANCLTTAFILSQRDAAIRRLLAGPAHLQSRYLPALAAGDQFTTVGLSQLTTSRQHQRPALRATPTSTGNFVLDGDIPWVTGADQAGAIVTGATLPDSNQVLVLLPTDLPGVEIGPPLPLAALAGSRTALVRCAGVEVARDLLLAGPAERVLRPGGGGGLETSGLAIGLAGAAADFLRRESATRPDLAAAADRFLATRDAARRRLHALNDTPDPQQTLALRAECTSLALRSTQAALLAAKGSGFVVPHPAQRWSRQALFFLVWSCPRPVAAGVLDDLLPSD